MPKIEITPGLKQAQSKGDVTVSYELIPFSTERQEIKERNITYADPSSPDFDVFEVVTKPIYIINPNELQFRIRVRNNQDRVLKLIDVPIILIVDGVQTSIPTEQLVEWKDALIVKNFEKVFLIHGPEYTKLDDAKAVYIAVHDVPTRYNAAGTVLKKENFEWTFKIEKQRVEQPDKIVYFYENQPVYKEQCMACQGNGYTVTTVRCSICNGSGVSTDKKGNRSKCWRCNGTGREQEEHKCSICSGIGFISYPKSPKPLVANEIIWTGWKVRVETNPPGAEVSVVDVNTSNYKFVGVSNIDVRWYSYSGQSYPIVVTLQGKELKVLPFSPDGKELSKVIIDFPSGGQPQVLAGRKVE